MNSNVTKTRITQEDTIDYDILIYGEDAKEFYKKINVMDKESADEAKRITEGRKTINTSLKKTVHDHVSVIPVEDRLAYACVADFMRKFGANDPLISKLNNCDEQGKLLFASALRDQKVQEYIQPDVHWMDASLFYDYGRADSLIAAFSNASVQDCKKQGKGLFKLKSNDIVYSLPYSLYMACANAVHRSTDISTVVKERNFTIPPGRFENRTDYLSVSYTNDEVNEYSGISRNEYRALLNGQLRSITSVEKKDKYFNVLLPFMKYHPFIGLVGCVYQIVRGADIQATRRNKKLSSIPIYIDFSHKKVAGQKGDFKTMILGIDSRVSILSDITKPKLGVIRTKFPANHDGNYLIPGACVSDGATVFQTPGGPVTLITKKVDPVKGSLGLVPGQDDACRKIWSCADAQKVIPGLLEKCKWSSGIKNFRRSKDTMVSEAMEAADTAATVRDFEFDGSSVIDLESFDSFLDECEVAGKPPSETVDQVDPAELTRVHSILVRMMVEGKEVDSTEDAVTYAIGKGDEFDGDLLGEFWKWGSVDDIDTFLKSNTVKSTVLKDISARAPGDLVSHVWHKKFGRGLTIEAVETPPPGCLLTAVCGIVVPFLDELGAPVSVLKDIGVSNQSPPFEMKWTEDVSQDIKARFD